MNVSLADEIKEHLNSFEKALSIYPSFVPNGIDLAGF
jgi:hypothetical protein